MSTAQDQSAFIQIDSANLEQGYRNSRDSAKRLFGRHLWMCSNLTGHERNGVASVMAYLARVSNFFDLVSGVDGNTMEAVADAGRGLPIEVWKNFRSEVSESLAGRSRSLELAALADTVERFQIPQQFITDPLDGADLWIEDRTFADQPEFDRFARLLGGGSLAMVTPILEPHAEAEVWQPLARSGGQAVFQTLLLSLFAHDLRQGQCFLPKAEIRESEVDLEKVKQGECDLAFRHFCRTQAARIEPGFQALGKLIGVLDFDGRRSLTTVGAWAWKTLMKIKSHPESILENAGALTNREWIGIKARHLLGLVGDLPFVHGEAHH